MESTAGAGFGCSHGPDRYPPVAVTRQRSGRANSVRLTDLRKLLEVWARKYDWTRNGRLAVDAPIGDAQRFLRRLPQSLPGVRWALTLQAGATLIAPHAKWDKIHLYVDVATNGELASLARK